jgi:hypothetical protein
MMQGDASKPLLETNISALATNSEEYAPRRKALSTAFFKSKIEIMSLIIKEVTLQHIKETIGGLKVGDVKTLDLVVFTRGL